MSEQLPTITRDDANHFVIAGELTMQTVPDLARAAQVLLSGTAANGELSVDFGGVSRADSAGLALLIELQRLARRQQSSIRFQHLPAQLEQILRLSELHEILPI